VLVEELVLDENEVIVCRVVPLLELDPPSDDDPCDDGDDDAEVSVCDEESLFVDIEEDNSVAEVVDVI
jgi:hypothetical protein